MKVYLMSDGQWQLFEDPSAGEFKERNISIGEGASIGEWASIGGAASSGEKDSFGETA